MKLISSIDFTKLQFPQLTESDRVAFLGSCFSDNIGKTLDFEDGNCLVNPFATLFHPASILKFLDPDYTLSDGGFVNLGKEVGHLDFQNKLRANSKAELKDLVQREIEAFHQYLKKCDCLFVTLGTAWYYRHLESDSFVGNCHKLPNSDFEKRLWSYSELLKIIKQALRQIAAFNSEMKIVFTVSPVKHLRDGVVDNMHSKSLLIASVHEVIKETPNTYYFPSYELLSEELRDYRFYAEDLAHPSNLAIKIIEEKFENAFMSSRFVEKKRAFKKIALLQEHKVLNSSEKENWEKQLAELKADFVKKWMKH